MTWSVEEMEKVDKSAVELISDSNSDMYQEFGVVR